MSPILPALVAIAAVFSGVSVASAQVGRERSICPTGAKLAPKRTQAVLRRLGAHAEGKGLRDALGSQPVVCYGNVPEGVLHTNGVVVLQKDHAVSANAARLGHLVFHLVHGFPLDEEQARAGAVGCDELVKIADRAEHAAHTLENTLRLAFGLPPLAFEDLSGAYRQRCEALREHSTGRPSL